MMPLSDAAVDRLRRLGSWPEFESNRYSVLEEIGRGGMGTVYLARDEELGREVAIKIPHSLGNAAFENTRRLETEARVLATLEHPGIVPIHDTGRLADGRVFYVMKRVQGQTLGEHLHAIADQAERLRVFERICEPVAFAHARGFIHRDLKPENVMVGSFGEVMVMDWGIAKVSGRPEATASVERQTGVGTVVGTRGFMAPEQARGATNEAEIDARVDVYSLGAMLSWLLTGVVPETPEDAAGRLRRCKIPRPLSAICTKALAADPAARYQSVTVLSEDVARYRAGGAVGAYRETAVERAIRFGRTYRTAILLVLAYIVMRAVVALVAGW
jgi:eukaryotic-like serine/threonine-protein kinase